MEIAAQIAIEYAQRKFKSVERDLIVLMQYEEIEELVYGLFLPYFNDGDLCLLRVVFIGPSKKFLSNETYYAVDSNNRLLSCNYFAGLEIEEAPWADREFLNSLSYDEFCEEIEKRNLTPSYKVAETPEALEEFAKILLKPNTEGVIRVAQDGKSLEIHYNEIDYES